MPSRQIAGEQIPAMTAIRGLAAWWIVLHHFRFEIIPVTGPTPLRFLDLGYISVDLFFQLSGFLILINYGERFAAFSWREYVRFIALRIGRIYPLHAFMLMIYLINPIAILLFSASGEVGAQYSPIDFVFNLFLIQNWGFTRELSWNYPAWSISTEFAAYLLFPVIVLLCTHAVRMRGGIGMLVRNPPPRCRHARRLFRRPGHLDHSLWPASMLDRVRVGCRAGHRLYGWTPVLHYPGKRRGGRCSDILSTV